MNLSKLRGLYCFSFEQDEKYVTQTTRARVLHWLMLAPGRGKSQLLINWCRAGRIDVLNELDDLLEERFPQLVLQPGYPGISTKEQLLRQLVSCEGRKGYTPLIAASRAGKDTVIFALLRMGAPRMYTDKKQMTALSHACSKGHASCVEALMQPSSHGEIVARLVDMPAVACITPLHFACARGHTKVVDALLDHAPELNARISSYHYIQGFSFQPMFTPLHLCAKGGHGDCIISILKSYMKRRDSEQTSDPRLARVKRVLPYEMAKSCIQMRENDALHMLHPSTDLFEFFPDIVNNQATKGPLSEDPVKAGVPLLDPDRLYCLDSSDQMPHCNRLLRAPSATKGPLSEDPVKAGVPLLDPDRLYCLDSSDQMPHCNRLLRAPSATKGPLSEDPVKAGVPLLDPDRLYCLDSSDQMPHCNRLLRAPSVGVPRLSLLCAPVVRSSLMDSLSRASVCSSRFHRASEMSVHTAKESSNSRLHMPTISSLNSHNIQGLIDAAMREQDERSSHSSMARVSPCASTCSTIRSYTQVLADVPEMEDGCMLEDCLDGCPSEPLHQRTSLPASLSSSTSGAVSQSHPQPRAPFGQHKTPRTRSRFNAYPNGLLYNSLDGSPPGMCPSSDPSMGEGLTLSTNPSGYPNRGSRSSGGTAPADLDDVEIDEDARARYEELHITASIGPEVSASPTHAAYANDVRARYEEFNASIGRTVSASPAVASSVMGVRVRYEELQSAASIGPAVSASPTHAAYANDVRARYEEFNASIGRTVSASPTHAAYANDVRARYEEFNASIGRTVSAFPAKAGGTSDHPEPFASNIDLEVSHPSHSIPEEAFLVPVPGGGGAGVSFATYSFSGASSASVEDPEVSYPSQSTSEVALPLPGPEALTAFPGLRMPLPFPGPGGEGDGSGALPTRTSAASSSDSECGICFAGSPDMAIAGCHHRLCISCAEELCKRVDETPAHCPFCRTIIRGFEAPNTFH
eukprot:gene4073-14167_t